jgi:quinoprotein glucose dehydrogenase
MQARRALIVQATAWFVVLFGLDCRAVDHATATGAEYEAGDDWPYYLGNAAGTHYSNLKDIHIGNVHRLQVAWAYDTKDQLGPSSTMESNPLVVAGRLFVISPNGRLISLEGATGRERWIFNPGAGPPGGVRNWRRGVSYWRHENEERVLFTFADDLYAVDAKTGHVISSFGKHGRVSLGGRASSPGVVYKDLIIMGGSQSSVRAFDIRTGHQRWKFHTIPRPGEFGYETWPKDAWKTASGANNWAGMTLDKARGILFVPLAFPQNHYGARRVGDNLFANSLVALDATTGKRLWHFQTIRHDLWDRDLPAPPTLARVRHHGRYVDAVAQVSKAGFVYVLDRLSGQPLFPMVETTALSSLVKGEITAKTQLKPLLPEPFARQRVTIDTLTRRTPEAAAAATSQFAKLSSRGIWDPPSEQGTIVFPGIDGGAEWGGAAVDPKSGILYVNSIEMAWILKIRRRSTSGSRTGSALYRNNCLSCHGEQREGRLPHIPSLLGIQNRLSPVELSTKIWYGGLRMPAFPELSPEDIDVLILYLGTGISLGIGAGQDDDSKHAIDDYVLDSVPKFLDPDGYPAISPPWGTLNAIDLNSGQYVWRIPFGSYPELVAQGMSDTGSENYGGPIVTAGGLLFIGATSFDKKFRAYDKRTGKLLWEAALPAAGIATPSTYRANGKQFVVIAAGGGRPPQVESGSKVIAFYLPETTPETKVIRARELPLIDAPSNDD